MNIMNHGKKNSFKYRKIRHFLAFFLHFLFFAKPITEITLSHLNQLVNFISRPENIQKVYIFRKTGSVREEP